MSTSDAPPQSPAAGEAIELQEADPMVSCSCSPNTAYVKRKRKSTSDDGGANDNGGGQTPTANHHHRRGHPRQHWWRARRWSRFFSASPAPVDGSPLSTTPLTAGDGSPLNRCPHHNPLCNTEIHLKSNGKVPVTETVLVAPLSTSVEAGGESEQPERETWDKRIDFLLSIIGFAVDLANVWRFPYLCYRNGGGAFLIPYFLMLIFGALPLFYMELILGQYHRQGPISLWKICPLFKGAGYCAVLVAFYVSFYYNVIIGWSFYFMFASFSPQLPWLHCNNTWNSDLCWDRGWREQNNLTVGGPPSNHTSAAMEYFEREVLELHKSSGVDDLGSPKWQLCLCVMLVYLLLYLSLFKGVRSSGKVVWVTATMPYVVLSILLVRGLMLPGAMDGILYFIRPDMSKLAHTQVWVDAAVQVFYSVGAGFGVHLTFSSYNNFNNNCYQDCLITTFINSFTSLFSGLVIFTYLGYMADYQQMDISKVATEGPGLVFQVYPEAIATLPGSNFWSFIFFFMLITLGMDSTMGGLESVITGFKDEFHYIFSKHRFSREIFMAGIMVISFSVATINLTRGGGFMLQWFDTYSAGVSLLCSALFEAVGISWFYGIDRFCEDVKEMLGQRPGAFWRICWKFVSPFFLVAVIIFAILFQQPLKYNNYVYPDWIETVGWVFALSSVFAIPLLGVIAVCQQKGRTWKEKFALSITPPKEHQKMLATGEVSRFKSKHWLNV